MRGRYAPAAVAGQPCRHDDGRDPADARATRWMNDIASRSPNRIQPLPRRGGRRCSDTRGPTRAADPVTGALPTGFSPVKNTGHYATPHGRPGACRAGQVRPAARAVSLAGPGPAAISCRPGSACVQPGEVGVVGVQMLVVVDGAARPPPRPGWAGRGGRAHPRRRFPGRAGSGRSPRPGRPQPRWPVPGGGDQAAQARPAHRFQPAAAAAADPVVHAPHQEDQHHEAEHDRVAADPHDRAARVQVGHGRGRPTRAAARRSCP